MNRDKRDHIYRKCVFTALYPAFTADRR